MTCTNHHELDCNNCGKCEALTYIDKEGEEKELTDEEILDIDSYELGR